jgi:hypothetical protein
MAEPGLKQRRRSFVSDAAESIRESIDSAVEEIKTKLTLSWHEIPDWMKDNEYIITGYRRWTTLMPSKIPI